MPSSHSILFLSSTPKLHIIQSRRYFSHTSRASWFPEWITSFFILLHLIHGEPSRCTYPCQLSEICHEWPIGTTTSGGPHNLEVQLLVCYLSWYSVLRLESSMSKLHPSSLLPVLGVPYGSILNSCKSTEIFLRLPPFVSEYVQKHWRFVRIPR